MIKYIKGNLFDTDSTIIAHGVNCLGRFGSGVAGYIKNNYPIVREKYLEKYEKEGWTLGDIQVVEAYGKKFINCATQHDCGNNPDLRYVNYDAVKTCLKKVKKFAVNKTVAIPMIGAGLANGDWDIIEEIIDDIFIEDIILVYYL
jgi:O-acetyl-ADP-ribose deacetylase (regulator of RNase III)